MLRGGTVNGVVGGFWKNLEKKGEDFAFEKLSHHRYGYFYALARDVRHYRDQGPTAVRNAMEETRHRISLNLSRSLKTISTCAALSPMLGLLGTVSGMVHTFENIKLFGFGNPVLFADGISEALLTTQAGLLMSDAMMFLINKGVDVNAKCGQGYSVLDWATNEGYTRLIKALKKAGAKNTPQYFKDSKK